MFVIPCKYSKTSNYIIQLVEDIRKYHPADAILVVDSNSSDKSYFNEISKFDVIIADISNKNWCVGAFWFAYMNFPNEPYYYFLHDSMRVKANLSEFRKSELVTIATFNRQLSSSFNAWNSRINNETKYRVTDVGFGCYGPMFCCSNKVISDLYHNNANRLLPGNKTEIGHMEGAFGALFEAMGFDMMKCSLFGDILSHECHGGKSGGSPPFNTSWQHPIEKFYGSHHDSLRL